MKAFDVSQLTTDQLLKAYGDRVAVYFTAGFCAALAGVVVLGYLRTGTMMLLAIALLVTAIVISLVVSARRVRSKVLHELRMRIKD